MVPLLVIGKYNNPRCFKNIKSLPVIYESNKKAWMTSKIFVAWLIRINSTFRSQNRNVLLFIDNCAAHPSDAVTFSNLKVLFFPPNTTSKLQPCDQGIIASLKLNYRSQLVQKMVDALDRKDLEQFSKKFSLFDAITLVHNCWNKVTEETISNCFRKAGFFSVPTIVDEETQIDEPIRNLWDHLREHYQLPEFLEFVNIDDNLITTENPLNDDIIDSENVADQENNDDDEQGPPPVIPSSKEAENMLNSLQVYFSCHADSVNFDIACSYITKLQYQLSSARIAATKQKKITDFFGGGTTSSVGAV